MDNNYEAEVSDTMSEKFIKYKINYGGRKRKWQEQELQVF